ncbi:hypothetical protein HC931_07715 [Candidatus Gracilibacteria bacterium]|nr:hypothetical protein [Candidatus Gracilibacteria bacterium]NJP22304.1 hypothetical protein [Hydrococcus sp. CRU_1_1]
MFQLVYGIATTIWTKLLKRPSIFVRVNQVKYMEVLHENQNWVRLGKRLF